jgi:CRISPR-associated exonuclease Cas4
MDNPGPLFTVTDLKQFAYCPRVVFYCYCLPLIRPMTYKMEESLLAHQEEAEREERRSLRPYGLTQGERRYDVPVASTRLGLRGVVDMVIDTGDEYIPVDYKSTFRKQPGAHFCLQLAAYGIMLEESLAMSTKISVRRGFLYSLLTRSAQEVALTGRLRAQVVRTVDALREMIQREHMPPAPRGRGRCVACEFRRFCNDC